MENIKYKEGDRVQIKSLDWYNDNKDEYGYVPCREYYFVPEMLDFCGKILTIDVDFEDKTYLMKEDIDGFVFTSEMIECKVEDENKPKFNVGDKVITDTNMKGKIIEVVEEGWYRVEFEPYNGMPQPNGVVPEEHMSLVEDEPNIDLAVKGEEVKERIEITIPEGYEYVIESDKIIFTKKKKEYPKTYEECLKVLGYEDIATHCIFHNEADEKLFNTLYDLKICRDAYWKIAGEEMGLGKPWEPDWSDDNEKYSIYTIKGVLTKAISCYDGAIFSFPTEEMRDAFKENFNPDLEICKEFL